MPSLILQFRSPWDTGWQLKGIFAEPDLSVTLSDVGWVGDVRFTLPRTQFDFLRLGDEVEIVNPADQSVLWSGKIVNLRYSSQIAQLEVTCRGLTEYLLDLPIDGILVRTADRTPFHASTLWRLACIAARRHWHRLAVPPDDLIGGVAARVADFRSQTLGDVWRFLIHQGKDLVLKASYHDSSGTIRLSLAERTTTVLPIPIHQFGDWELEYESRHIQNRILAPDKAEESQNLTPDPSFEDLTGSSWQVQHQQGTGGWTITRRNLGLLTDSASLCSHLTSLQVLLPPSSPPNAINIYTREPIPLVPKEDGSPNIYTVTVFARASASLGQLNAFLVRTDGVYIWHTPIPLQAGWRRYSWQWSIGPGGQPPAQYHFGIQPQGDTTVTLTIFLDSLLATRYYASAVTPQTMPLPVGASEDSLLPDNNAFLSSAIFATVLAVTPVSGTTYDLWIPGWSLSGRAGWKGHLWDPFSNTSWSFTVHSTNPHPAPDVLRVTLSAGALPTNQVLFMRFWSNPDGSGYPSEALYGIRYATEPLSDYEKPAYHTVHQQPEIIFRGTLTDWDEIVTPDQNLSVVGYPLPGDALPIVSNDITLHTGHIVAQRLIAGSRQFTFRALIRKMRQAQPVLRLRNRL
ncbi:MAG: hypothetical protein NZ959_10430 [Armatimonadetes bacterium]|nr:hypothetical protein [Armatimonadota bacterium]MDW8122711.1 hypothetical protein [Armatimonadota bacterium]